MQALTNFLKIIRWKNAAIFIILQILLYFYFFDRKFEISDAWLFLILSILFFGIFGNIHNNITDYELDRNKNNFIAFDKTTYLIYTIIFVILGVILGFTAFYFTFSPTLLYAILVFPISLGLYNIYLKKLPLLGNLLIAFLTTFAIYVPIAYAKNIDAHQQVFYFLLIMSFLLTLIREIIKDLEDANIDRLYGYKTLPVINKRWATIIVYGLGLVFFVLLGLSKNTIPTLSFYSILTISIIFFALSTKLMSENKYHQVSQLIKILMFLGFVIIILLS